MSPDGLRGGEAGARSACGSLGQIAIPSIPRTITGERVPVEDSWRRPEPKVPDTMRKRGEAEMAQHGEAPSTTR